jgi:hypothetical protein
MTKNGFGYILGDLFSRIHPVTLVPNLVGASRSRDEYYIDTLRNLHNQFGPMWARYYIHMYYHF